MRSSEPASPLFLEKHDLAISKLGAGRPKDVVFVDALIRAGVLDLSVLAVRSDELAGVHPDVAQRISDHLKAYPVPNP